MLPWNCAILFLNNLTELLFIYLFTAEIRQFDCYL